MMTGKKSFLFLYFFPLVLLFGMSQDFECENGLAKVVYVDSIDVSFRPRVELDDIHGDLMVLGGADKIVLEQHCYLKVSSLKKKKGLHKIFEENKAAMFQKGHQIVIRGNNRNPDLEIEYVLRVPTESDIKGELSGADVECEYVSGKVELKTGGGDIEVGDIKGQVILKTSGGDIEVKDVEGPVTASTSGGDVTISRVDGNIDVSTSGGDIWLREVKGTCDLHTSGGSIEIMGCRGKKVFGKTSGGDIIVRDLLADIYLRTSGGDIEVEGIAGDATLKTSGGDIRIDSIDGYGDISTSGGNIFVEYSGGDIVLNTSGGDVEVKKVIGEIDATTSGGDVWVKKYSREDGSLSTVELESSGGNITLYLPKGCKATVRAEIVMRKRSRGKYSVHSDFPLSMKEEEAGRKIVLRATGDINGGGDIVELKTGEGDIFIKKF